VVIEQEKGYNKKRKKTVSAAVAAVPPSRPGPS